MAHSTYYVSSIREAYSMFTVDEWMNMAPQQVWIDLTAEDIQWAKQQMKGQAYSSPNSYHQIYQNWLCLRLSQRWLEEDLNTSPVPWLSMDELPSVWDVLNGFIVEVQGIRLALIPSDALEVDELRIPQEWVDSPWVADYYVSAQINLEDGWGRILGYAPHKAVKTAAQFQERDRSYCLDQHQLIDDFNVLWVEREVMPNPTPIVPDILPLGAAIAQSLITDLATIKRYSPRLDVPFGQWAALITHSDYRQSLYQHRTTPTIVRLQQWLQGQITSGWNAVQTLAETDFQGAIARGSSSSSQGERLVIDGKVSLRVQIEPVNHAAKDTASSEYRVSIRACLSQPLETAQYLSLSCSGGDEDDCQASTPNDSNLELLPLIGEAGEAFEVTLVLGEQQETVQFML